MKRSDYVLKLNSINAINTTEVTAAVNALTAAVTGIIPDTNSLSKLSAAIADVDLEICAEQKRLAALRDSITLTGFSSDLNNPTTVYKQLDYVDYATTIHQILAEKININCSWQHPALYYEPVLGTYTNKMLAADPLYMVSKFKLTLTRIRDQFNPVYKRRIRLYNNLNDLPVGQFGTAVSIGYFEFCDINQIRNTLFKIESLLKPGGTFIFTYNNCNVYESCVLAEHTMRSFCTDDMIKQLTAESKLDIIELTDHNPNLSYAIVKKQGVLKTNRAAQTLGHINHGED